MKDKIELDNNYYLEILNESINYDLTDITKLKLNQIIKRKKFLLKIDFKFLNKKDYKKILKKLLRIKRIVCKLNRKRIKNQINIGIEIKNKKLLGYVINYDKKNKNQNDFISAINAIFYNNKYEMYNYIYDNVCNYLDSFFYGKNFCDFENNKCGEKRNTNSKIGCCRHYKNKLLGPLLSNNLIPCEYLKDNHTCGAKSLGCKLFTCDYLRSKGVRFKIKDILLLDVFFNQLQKYYIKTSVYKPKDKILKQLMVL